MAQIILQNPLALLLLPVLWLVVVAVAWPRRFKPFGAFLLRLAIIVFVVLALAQPIWIPEGTPDVDEQEKLIILVDQSASISLTQRQMFQTEIDALLAQSSDITVLNFSDTTIIDSAEDVALLDPHVSNLAQALQVGGQMLGSQSGRLLLFSDGVPTDGDTNTAITALADKNIPVDVFTWNDPAQSNDVVLVEMRVPDNLRQGEEFDVEFLIHTNQPTEAELKLWHNDQLLNQAIVSLNMDEGGGNRSSFSVPASELGPQTFRATLTAANDSEAANNTLSAYTQVYPSPRVLVVGDDAAEITAFADWLQQDGFMPDTIGPTDLPNRLSELEPYAGIILLDVSARSLELEQMKAMQEFVRSLGRGLLVTGGRNSFSLGKYEDTPLAELLPLSLEPPAREERPPVTLLLIIDHSGSMVESRGDLGTRLVLAKEAAIRSTDILAPQDLIGVLIFDTDYQWIVPFKQVSDGATLLEIQQDISAIQPGSATRILAALKEGVATLMEQQSPDTTRQSHVVLFSDGTSYDVRDAADPDNPTPDYDAIVDAALNAEITLSTISIGGDTDVDLMARLAERGRGRYHYAGSPDELPELTIAESDILRSSAVQEGEFDIAAAVPHPMVRGFAANCAGADCEPDTGTPIPPLSGYIAMTPKPQAEVALQAGAGDPLLGVWGYGLGRVAAWSSDTGIEWAQNWRVWPEVSDYWGQVVDYTLPAPGLGLLQLQATVDSNSVVTLSADGVTASGQTVDLSRTDAVLTTPGGRDIPLTLRQTAPGHYQQQVKVADTGIYQFSVTQSREDADDEIATIGFAVPYPAEYALPDINADAGLPLLEKIATATGGQMIVSEQTVVGDEPATAAIEIVPEPVELWPWCLLVALILWPLEIAWRRWGRLRI